MKTKVTFGKRHIINCKNCNEVIKGNLILNCSCGSFCSQECLKDYHHGEIKK